MTGIAGAESHGSVALSAGTALGDGGLANDIGADATPGVGRVSGGAGALGRGEGAATDTLWGCSTDTGDTWSGEGTSTGTTCDFERATVLATGMEPVPNTDGGPDGGNIGAARGGDCGMYTLRMASRSTTAALGSDGTDTLGSGAGTCETAGKRAGDTARGAIDSSWVPNEEDAGAASVE